MPPFVSPRLLVAALLTATAGCAADVPPAAWPGAAECATRAGGSRWASSEPYVETASYGRTEATWLHEVGGVAVADSIVYVYDAPEARVVVLDDRLRYHRSFGRAGGGPGELRPILVRGMLGSQWNWLTLAGDTLVLFDGLAVHRFAGDGRFAGRGFRRAVDRTELNDGSPVVADAGGTLLSSGGGYHLPALQEPVERYTWRVLRHSDRRTETLLSLRLEPLPERRGGVTFQGPTQARPVWTASGDCVFATDGAGGWLAITSLAGGGADTLRFELPDVPLPPVDRDEIARLSGMASRGTGNAFVEPTALLRIEAVAVDPDGYVWVLPAQDPAHLGDRVEVLRISPASGAVERDTIPAFPLVFGAPGVFYARNNDRFGGEAHVTRYDLRGQTLDGGP